MKEEEEVDSVAEALAGFPASGGPDRTERLREFEKTKAELAHRSEA